ncbi:hypothetical protein KI387_040024, partial [Taxus chinensis]
MPLGLVVRPSSTGLHITEWFHQSSEWHCHSYQGRVHQALDHGGQVIPPDQLDKPLPEQPERPVPSQPPEFQHPEDRSGSP